MRRGTLFIVIGAVALIAATIALLVARFRSPIRLIPCPPNLALNGSFEGKLFTGTGLLFLDGASNAHNCAPGGSGPCLDAWTITTSITSPNPNLLTWAQSPVGITGVPSDPNFMLDPNERKFINLSGQTNMPDFPSVSQSIKLVNGSYELRFKLGQGSGNFVGPASVNVSITGAATLSGQFTTDPNQGPWQAFSLTFGSNGGDIQLTFTKNPIRDTTMALVGLDNVSLEQLKPIPDCPSP